MPRKVFTAGEILTAADVNTNLMDQAVMVFDDSTARTAAIPTPSEGMITYLSDTNAVEKYDGSAFRPVSGLVQVKSALKTDTFTASVASGGNVAVTDLSITHEVSDPANKLIIAAFFGMAANSNDSSMVGLAIHDGTGLIAVGSSPGSRTSVSSAGRLPSGGSDFLPQSVIFSHTPGAGSKTYTVRAINFHNATSSVFINRNESDENSVFSTRGVSSLVIQEVTV